MNFGTHQGRKTTELIYLDENQVRAIKDQPDTARGRRDALLVCLALDHGLRVGELASLQAGDFQLAAGTLTFYRSETGRRDTHKLSEDTLEAARRYFAAGSPGIGSAWGPGPSGQGVSTTAISRRIRALGKRIAIENLSPQDLRHTWATNAAKNTPLDKLIYAGGWTSVSAAMPYVQNAKIAYWT